MVKIGKTAAIILNRNLPHETELLRHQLISQGVSPADIFIVESGSEECNLAPNHSFYADWEDALEHGLRYPNGMNFGISRVRKLHPKRYDSYLLLANDTIILTPDFLSTLRSALFGIPRCGLVSPCGVDWGEAKLLKDEPKAFWHIHNNCYLVAESLVQCIGSRESGYKNALFDGSNFRGFCSDTELIAKAYINDFMCVITPGAVVEENENLLRERYSLIRTENEDENWDLYIREGLAWIRQKYGFTSHWDMNNYAVNAYKQFFKWYPALKSQYSIL